MKNLYTYLFPLRLLAFWLLFFGAFRLWFVLWFRTEWSVEDPGSAWLSFWHALPLDLSFAAYLIALPLLLWQLGVLFGPRTYRWSEKGILGFNGLLLGLLIFVFGANLFIYEEWKTPLNNRAVQYFKTPNALLDSMSFIFKVICFLLFAGAFWVLFKGYKKVVGVQIYPGKSARWNLLGFPVWLGLLVLAIRGGTGVMPINESAVYYSPNLFHNHAATNPGWSLCHSLIETRSTVNRFAVMPDSAAMQRLQALMDIEYYCGDFGRFQFFEDSDSLPKNVVFLILESHTAQVIEALGGEPGVCPNLNRLIQEGILFQNIYGSGYRTDQGIVSVLAGYPAQPDQSIILLDDKAAKLPSVPKTLKTKGYSTAFFYGGELTFANLGLWLANQRFDKIFSEKDFSSREKTQRWGVDDSLLLQRAIQEINTMRQPFFATAMTLSLHPPYDVPFKSKWTGNSDREQFLNSASFVDHAIGAFFKRAEQQPWFEHTIFVLVADHGASQPGGLGMDLPASRHIPLIIFGKPLLNNWKGRKVDVYGNHHDIPATLINMLYTASESEGQDYWSQDLFMKIMADLVAEANGNKYSGFSYYTNENGLGWVTPNGKGFYEFGSKTWRIFEGKLDENDKANAQAYLQMLYQDFLRK